MLSGSLRHQVQTVDVVSDALRLGVWRLGGCKWSVITNLNIISRCISLNKGDTGNRWMGYHTKKKKCCIYLTMLCQPVAHNCCLKRKSNVLLMWTTNLKWILLNYLTLNGRAILYNHNHIMFDVLTLHSLNFSVYLTPMHIIDVVGLC